MEVKKEKATLIKVFPIQREKNGINIDSILIFYRDERGEKKTRFIDRAEVPFYILKDKESIEAESQPLFIEKEKVEKHICFSDKLYETIAVQTDSVAFYDDVLIKKGPRSNEMKNLMKHPFLYDTDMDLADRYIREFHDEFDPNPDYQLYKCYFDIEVDIMEYNGFPDEEIAPCPLSIVTLIDGKYMTSHSFIVRNSKNKSLCEFEENIEEFKRYITTKIATDDETVLNGIDVNFYDSELEAITAFFNLVHHKDPDFMLAWNQGFDALTLINRLKKLYSIKTIRDASGVNPYDAMLNVVCDGKYLIQQDELGNEVYLTPRAKYTQQKDKPFVDRMDYFIVFDGIQWFDQMLCYANIRKSSGQKESYSLDAIAYEEIGREKLEFAPGETIKNLSWKNYKKFCEYNIRDVLLLTLLEEKNLDMNLMQFISEITSTRTEKVLKKTISLKNYVNKFANEQGFIMNNNKNAKYGTRYEEYMNTYVQKTHTVEHDENYKELFVKKENFGAYVADPLLNTNKNGVEIVKGRPNPFILQYVFDMDFSALYPSILQAFNLAPTTQIGKFFLIDPEIKRKLIEECNFQSIFMESANSQKLESTDETTDLGPALSNFIQASEFSKIGSIFMNLPTTEALISKLKEKK